VAALDDAVAAFNPTERIKGRRSSRVIREDSGMCLTATKVQFTHEGEFKCRTDYADRFYRTLNVEGWKSSIREAVPGCSHVLLLHGFPFVFSYVPQSDSHACG